MVEDKHENARDSALPALHRLGAEPVAWSASGLLASKAWIRLVGRTDLLSPSRE
jgi:hypothetical protein